MGAENLIDGLVGQLQQVNGFEQGNTGTAVAYDERVLAQGVDRAAIVYSSPRGEQKRMVIGGKAEFTHFLQIGLFIRHNNDVVTARREVNVYRSNIVTRLNANPTLGGSAFDALVESYELEDEKLIIGKVPFYAESLTVRATEIIDVS